MNWRTSSHSAANGACVEVGGWRTSAYSGTGNCVEVAGWRASSFCDGGQCVEVGSGSAVVGVRDTKQNGAGPVLAFPAAAWRAFTASLVRDKADTFC